MRKTGGTENSRHKQLSGGRKKRGNKRGKEKVWKKSENITVRKMLVVKTRKRKPNFNLDDTSQESHSFI